MHSPTAFVVGRSALPFIWTGSTAVILGGIVAAATSPLALEHGSWAAAYLVLVVGVALVALGTAQSHLAPAVGSLSIALELGGWLLGSAAVIGGTILGVPLIVDAGGILLLVSLITFAVAVRKPATASPVTLLLFRIVLLVIIVSMPIGLVLAHLRHG